jgi:hypothetical protein
MRRFFNEINSVSRKCVSFQMNVIDKNATSFFTLFVYSDVNNLCK